MSEETKKPKEITSKVFSIVQDMKNPITGEIYLTEEKIIEALNHKMIEKYAYILHDKDVYDSTTIKKLNKRAKEWEEKLNDPEYTELSKEDIQKHIDYYSSINENTIKNPHWHIAITLSNTTPLKNVAKWFGVPPQYVEPGRPICGTTKYSFHSLVTYMVHRTPNSTHKYQYPIEEVKANIDVETYIQKFLRFLQNHEITLDDVLEELLSGKPISWVEKTYTTLYIKHKKECMEAHNLYLDSLPPPRVRLNIVISGEGGNGKSLVAYNLARALGEELFPDREFNNKDLFFSTGASKVALNGYTDQPIVIYDDFRGWEVKNSYGKETATLLKALEIHPKTLTTQNTKGGYTRLRNYINIFDSVENKYDFANDLIPRQVAGKDEDDNPIYFGNENREQIDRRLQCFVDIGDASFSFSLDSLIGEGRKTYPTSFVEYGPYKADFKKMAEYLGADEEVLYAKIKEKLSPLLNKIIPYLKANLTAHESDMEQRLREYEEYENSLELVEPNKTPQATTNQFKIVKAADWGKVDTDFVEVDEESIKQISELFG